jgi:multiple sugar transport system permease protein
MGYASALAWLLFLIILALTIVMFRWSAFWVYYEGAPRRR